MYCRWEADGGRRKGSVVAGVQPLMDGREQVFSLASGLWLRVAAERARERDEDLAKPNVKRRLCLVLIAMASRWELLGLSRCRL